VSEGWQEAQRRADGQYQPARRRRRGLPAARAHTRLPRQIEGEEPEDQCADGDRYNSALPALVALEAMKDNKGLGSGGEEVESALT
jgi:hypothetical protein